MDSKVTGLTIGIIVLALVLGSIIFLLRDQLYSEITEVATPWGGCLEKWNELRDKMGKGEAYRLDAYEMGIFEQFASDNCAYYVFRWIPEGYPERSYLGKAWYHEFRTDLSEEVKQTLRDNGYWPD